ncbi:MAG: tetratricopeptide repeat protein, partial [Jatrophihabitans endophyticus]|nr:tetratricopeptide repeat protein [Jatrophihabitans endophyticus]
MSAAMSGAVDLAALKARNEAAARAAEAPPPAAGQYVVDTTEASFQADVLDRSFQVPVLLLATSSRAPSSEQLATSLTSVVNAARGALVLVKVDADANPRIVQALQMRGVPAVFAVIGGQLVPGFEGALPDDQVREFVDAVLQAAQQAGVQGTPAPEDESPADTVEQPAEPQVPDDPRFTAAEDAIEAGDYPLAIERYESILASEPANAEAALALGQVRLMQRLGTVDETAVARADAAPDDVDAQLAAADLLLASNDVQGAFDRLLAAVTRTSGDDRDRLRRRMLEFFELLG